MISLAVGRFLYAFGYSIKGPMGRIPGALIYDLALLAAFVGAIVSIVQWDTKSDIPLVLPLNVGK